MSQVPDPAERIFTLEQAVAWRAELRKKNLKLVVTNGCFDLMHRGHAEYLRESRNLGDALLVLINSDESVSALKGPSRPFCDEYSRAYLLRSLRCVDAVTVFHSMRCASELSALRPDIYVKGGDYTLDKLDPEERSALLNAGTVICFKKFVSGFSTTSLMEKIRSVPEGGRL